MSPHDVHAACAGNDELARQALSKRKVFEETAAGLQEQLALQQSSVDKLIDDTRTLEAKIQDAKTKKDTLKARAQAAKTTSKVTGVVGSIDTSNALAAFEKMEEKVLRLEAEADAISSMSEVDKLTDEFKLLKGTDDIDAELAAMKKEIEGPKKPVGELPAGREPAASSPGIFLIHQNTTHSTCTFNKVPVRRAYCAFAPCPVACTACNPVAKDLFCINFPEA